MRKQPSSLRYNLSIHHDGCTGDWLSHQFQSQHNERNMNLVTTSRKGRHPPPTSRTLPQTISAHDSAPTGTILFEPLQPNSTRALVERSYAQEQTRYHPSLTAMRLSICHSIHYHGHTSLDRIRPSLAHHTPTHLPARTINSHAIGMMPHKGGVQIMHGHGKLTAYLCWETLRENSNDTNPRR